MNTIIALAWVKIENDYNEIINDYLKKTPEEIIENAYFLAHVREIYFFFENIDMEYPPFYEDTFKNIANYQDNVIIHIYNSWLGYSHPERYNFFCYEDLVDIIREAF